MTLQTCVPENFRSCRWGDERTVKRAQTGSEDPHRRERKFCVLLSQSSHLMLFSCGVEVTKFIAKLSLSSISLSSIIPSLSFLVLSISSCLNGQSLLVHFDLNSHFFAIV